MKKKRNEKKRRGEKSSVATQIDLFKKTERRKKCLLEKNMRIKIDSYVLVSPSAYATQLSQIQHFLSSIDLHAERKSSNSKKTVINYFAPLFQRMYN
jgi:hypothetical protein